MRHALPLLLLPLLFGGCDPAAKVAPGAGLSGGFILPPAATEGAAEPPPRSIVRTGELQFCVADLEAAHATITARATEHGGYIADDVTDHPRETRRLTMSVRVPVAQFDAFVAAIEPIGTLEQRHLGALDATTTCVDMAARLAAKNVLEQRYLELTARAANIAEMLEVERELGKVRADIESMAAQLASVQDQVAMSTLTITCRQPDSAANVAGFAAALQGGWSALVRALVSLTYAWPLLLLATTIAVAAWVRRRATRAPPPLPTQV